VTTLSTEAVQYAADDGIAVITLNRPQTLNALDRPARRLLGDALREAESAAVRAVILTGAGRAFSVGQDVAELQADYAAEGPRLARLIHEEWAPLVAAIRQSAKPYVAAVNGAAAGGGLSLALACDIRLGEPGTQFIAAFMNVGLVPDSGAAHMLVRALGTSRTMHLVLTGGRLSADEAYAAGLVASLSASPAALLDDARTLARRLAAHAPLAVAAAKLVVNQAADRSFTDVVALEAEHQDQLGRTEDHQEALRAFLEKRPPSFRGR
jgi:2-(1,2-epoxy-1,2-dihydrophenyl)acetyl-CoA isomerase